MSALSYQTKKDSDFLKHLDRLLEENLDDDRFGILKLCQTIGLSRMQLHRKIKSLNNTSTSIYIRSFRLKKGKEMIENSNKKITAIAFEVGFKDPAYFCRCFKNKYNISPSGARKSL